jgi:phospholipase/carboxylesterase
VLELLDPERRMVGVTARGPLELPPGGAHWYLSRTAGHPDKPTFGRTLELMSQWVDGLGGLIGFGVERTVLGGFSQGAVMAYALGLGAGRPSPAGLIALSGFVPQVEGFGLDLADRAGLPVAIGHGSGDPLIGVEFGRAAGELLGQAGLAVIYREYPLAHTVDPSFLVDLRPWLRAALS